MATLNNAFLNTRYSKKDFFFVHSALLTLTSAGLKDVKKRKKQKQKNRLND